MLPLRCSLARLYLTIFIHIFDFVNIFPFTLYQYSLLRLQYVRRIYQTGLGIAATCDMNTITAEYYGSCNNLNFCTIIPQKSEFMKFVNQVTNQESLNICE